MVTTSAAEQRCIIDEDALYKFCTYYYIIIIILLLYILYILYFFSGGSLGVYI